MCSKRSQGIVPNNFVIKLKWPGSQSCPLEQKSRMPLARCDHLPTSTSMTTHFSMSRLQACCLSLPLLPQALRSLLALFYSDGYLFHPNCVLLSSCSLILNAESCVYLAAGLCPCRRHLLLFLSGLSVSPPLSIVFLFLYLFVFPYVSPFVCLPWLLILPSLSVLLVCLAICALAQGCSLLVFLSLSLSPSLSLSTYVGLSLPLSLAMSLSLSLFLCLLRARRFLTICPWPSEAGEMHAAHGARAGRRVPSFL